MDNERALTTILLADAGVVSLVGAKVFVGAFPQQQRGASYLPSVIIQAGEFEDTYTMRGPTNGSRGSVSAVSWAVTRDGCQEVLEAVRKALAGFRNTEIHVVGSSGSQPVWDAEAKHWFAIVSFDVWATEVTP